MNQRSPKFRRYSIMLNVNILLCIAASEPFAVSQETTNILNRNNTATERDTHDEPPSMFNYFLKQPRCRKGLTQF